jgi:O-acetylserine/cysteine efflux transporter
MPASAIFQALLVQTIWGFNIIVAKAGVEAMPPLFFTTVRFALVAALVVPFFSIPRGAMKHLLLLSFTFGTVHFGLLFTGLTGMDAAGAAILIQLGAPFTVVLGVFLFKEKLGPRRILGTLLAFGGVVLLAGEPGRAELWPVILMTLAALGWALSNVVVKRMPDLNPLLMTGWLSLMAVPQVGLMSLVLEDGQIPALISADWRGWGAIVYTAAGASIIAHSLWYGLVRRHEMGQVAPFGLLAPVIGIVAAVLVLGEPLTWQKLVGGGLTMVGVAIIQLRWARLRKRPPTEAGSPT